MPRKNAPKTPEDSDSTILPGLPGEYLVLGHMTDKEVTDYVAFLLESVAHLQGRLGSLNTHNLLGLAARVRRIGSAHNMNVKIATNWAAGPRVLQGGERGVIGTTLGKE